MKQSFVYGREFLGDADLNARAFKWLDTVANVRDHRTTREQPIVRFERDEPATLRPLPSRSNRSLVLPLERAQPRRSKTVIPVPKIEVERRPLHTYSLIAGGGS